ncbi:peptidase [Shinella sp. M31]|uniref:peptidase n=1 Tax=Shinella sp. M31 TaxID=3368615 RepID=UPI003BA2A33C
MKPFEIFRSGNHTTSKGAALSFSESDLAAIASSYDPANYEAPIVVGHPKTNAPAFGWVKSLEVKGDRLVAVPGEVNDEFSEMVRAGSFKTRSVALYRPDQPGNPTPGQYHLRHVGFLGAEPPAVKGLKAVEFSDAEDDTIEFSGPDIWNYAWALDGAVRIFRRVREYFIAKDGLEAADEIIPEYEISQISQHVADTRAEARASDRVNFSETAKETETMKTAEQRQAELDAREAEIVARETKVKADETTFAETARKTRAEADAAFVAEIVTQGRLPVGLQASATALFSELDDAAELTFSEGDQEVKTTPRAALRDLLGKLPVPVATGEVATGDGPDFSDAKHVQTAIETEIRKAADKGETISPAVAAMRLKANG